MGPQAYKNREPKTIFWDHKHKKAYKNKQYNNPKDKSHLRLLQLRTTLGTTKRVQFKGLEIVYEKRFIQKVDNFLYCNISLGFSLFDAR